MVAVSEIQRGEVWWADLAPPRKSEPGYRRPVLILQADAFNRSRIATAVVAVITSNLALAEAPGTVLLPAESTGLPKDSVVNLSQILTLDRTELLDCVGNVPPRLQRRIDEAARTVLGLHEDPQTTPQTRTR